MLNNSEVEIGAAFVPVPMFSSAETLLRLVLLKMNYVEYFVKGFCFSSTQLAEGLTLVSTVFWHVPKACLVQRVPGRPTEHIFPVPWDELVGFEKIMTQMVQDVDSGTLTTEHARIIYKHPK